MKELILSCSQITKKKKKRKGKRGFCFGRYWSIIVLICSFHNTIILKRLIYMSNLSRKYNKTQSLPVIKNKIKIRINQSSVFKKQDLAFPGISETKIRAPLTQRLQRSIGIIQAKIKYDQSPQSLRTPKKEQQINQQLSSAKIALEMIHQIRLQFEKYNTNTSFKKIDAVIQRMKQKQLVRQIWNTNKNITQKKLLKLLQKYSTFFKDANYIINISKGVLSQFKNNRWNNIEADINRKKNSIERAVFKIGNKLNFCQSQVKIKIIDTVSKINPECPANRIQYKEWNFRAENQLRSRRIFNQLLEHQVYSKL